MMIDLAEANTPVCNISVRLWYPMNSVKINFSPSKRPTRPRSAVGTPVSQITGVNK